MIQKRASLDERTVQKVARGEHETPRHRRARGKSANSRVTSSHMLDGLGAEASAAVLALGVDLRCVQVISSTEAIVWNHTAPWPAGSESEPEAT